MPRPLQLGRRTFLRGALGGAALSFALPPLEAMLNVNGTAFADGAEIPRKLLVWFFGTGVHAWYGDGNHVEKWVPLDAQGNPQTGPDWVPNELMQPFASDPDIKPYVNVISGMNSKTAIYAHDGIFASLCGCFGVKSDGVTILPNGNSTEYVWAQGPSVDQVFASSIPPGATRFRSLEVSSAPELDPKDIGYAQYIVSHNGPGSVNVPRMDPRRAFADLFGMGTAAVPDPAIAVGRSVVDGVMADAAALRAQLGMNDRRRLDQYLSDVRDLETRLAAPVASCDAVPAELATKVAALTDADLATLNLNYMPVNDVWSRMLALALSCDLTRVASYIFVEAGSFNRFNEIGVDQMHHLAHNETTPGQPELTRGIEFAMQRFGDTLKILRSTPVATGNLLDYSCVLATSELSRAYNHDKRDWPVVLVGKAGGGLKYPGVHFRREPVDDIGRLAHPGGQNMTPDGQGGDSDHRPTADDNLSRVPLTVLHALGVPAQQFGYGRGQVTQPISEVLAG